MQRFPTVLLIDPSGLVYEFNGRRGLPPLLAFAQGGYRAGAAHMMLPEVRAAARIAWLRGPVSNHGLSHWQAIEADVSDYWLLAEALWPPFKKAAGISLAIVLGLKAFTKGLLWWLKPASGDGGGRGEEARDKVE